MSVETVGRRVRPTGRAGVLGVMVVGLSAAFLTLAGTTPRGIGSPTGDASRVSLDQRTFSCAGGIAGSRARSGTLAGGLVPERPIGDLPVRITEDRTAAPGAFAGQQATPGKALAWAPCAEPRARWWFVGAGGAAVTHDTVLTIDNPRTSPAVVDVDVLGPRGPVAAPGLHGLTLAPGATRVLDLAKAAPAVGNLALSVTATRGLVAVSAADRFSPGAVGAPAREWLPPQPTPATQIVLAGLPAVRSSASLVLANPRHSDAIATLTVVGTTGTFSPRGLEPVTVPAESVVTVPLTGVLDGSPMAIRITSTLRITATIRAVRGGDTAFATGVRPVLGSTAFAVPSGAGRLVLSSLDTADSVHVVVHDDRGRVVLDRAVGVPRSGSVAVPLAPRSAYVAVTTTGSDVVAGFTVSGARGVATAGVLPAIRSIQLPAVRPGW